MAITSTAHAECLAHRRADRILIFIIVTLSPAAGFAQTLPPGWDVSDVGAAPIPGVTAYAAQTYTVSGSGSGVQGTADQFTFVYRQITGDATLIARVNSLPLTMPNAQAGVMIRQELGAGSKHGAVLVSRAAGVTFERRRSNSGTTATTTSGSGSTSAWLRIDRRGSAVVASWSADGTLWTAIGTDTVSLNDSLYVGLVVASRTIVAPVQVPFTGVEAASLVEYGGPLPAGWTSQDIGAPGQPGAAAFDTGTFGIRGGGTDISGTWDQFHYAYAVADGDVDIVARVRDLGNTNALSKAGVMIRDSLTGNGTHASMFVTASGASTFRRRALGGGGTVDTPGPTRNEPVWVKLSLRGGEVTASWSANGSLWTVVGTETVTLPSPFYVGLAVTSRNNAATVTTNIDRVSLTVPPPQNSEPTVALTEPANGATFEAPATIGVGAEATDADGTIAKVDFFEGSILIGSDTTAPYSVTWSNVAAGVYSLTAVATDDDGATTTSAARTVTVNAPANQPPTAALTAPANGATFTAPANITITANATDTDGTVARVDFYRGSTLLGSDTTSPYSFAWNNVPAGTYTLTARATDDDGATTVSAARTVTVNAPANQPPTAALTAPANGATFTAPATIPITANATDTDGTVARVDFYQGSTLLGSDTTSPYSFAWTNVPAGTYSLTARATDDDGVTTASAARTVTVNAPANQPPSASLTAPANGATFAAPANITITANAADTDGTVVRVEFYQGSTLLGSDTTSPYSFAWNNVPAGSYSLTARAVDDDGAITTSVARSISVTSGPAQRRAVFTASADHNTLVNSYLLEIFAAGANPATATPIATQNLGKPAVVNGECTVDVTTTINGLSPGTYQATVSAVGSGGSARSDAATFSR